MTYKILGGFYMKKLILFMLLVIALWNSKFIYNIAVGNHLIGHFENQMFFDNGKEIYVVELQPKLIMKGIIK